MLNRKRFLTFHPHRDLGTTIVSAGAFGRKKISRWRLEPVPSREEISVADRRPVTNREMVIEAALGLASDDLVISLVAGVVRV